MTRRSTKAQLAGIIGALIFSSLATLTYYVISSLELTYSSKTAALLSNLVYAIPSISIGLLLYYWRRPLRDGLIAGPIGGTMSALYTVYFMFLTDLSHKVSYIGTSFSSEITRETLQFPETTLFFVLLFSVFTIIGALVTMKVLQFIELTPSRGKVAND